jgi:hypothetical protein
MTATFSLSGGDRQDIIDLYARYAWALDLADAVEMRACFAPDGWFDHLWQGRVHGRDAIIENFERMWYDRPAWWFGRQHLFNTFRFMPHNINEVRVKCFNQIIQFNTEYNNNFVFGIGTRDDLIVRQEEGWVFQSLYVNAWLNRDDVPWKGEMHLPPLHPPRPDLSESLRDDHRKDD